MTERSLRSRTKSKHLTTLALCLFASAASAQTAAPREGDCRQPPGYSVDCVRPSTADPAIQRFDTANYVIVSQQAKPNGQLLLFLPGTGGVPSAPRAFLRAAADAGYFVVSLMYNDDVSIAVYCPTRPNSACSGMFRRMRIYGNIRLDDATVDNTPAEAIVTRFVKLLQHLDRAQPGRGWGSFVKTGAPDWQRVVVSGHSQGAGMAAFIAKEHEVARAILFSSPWDYVQRQGRRDLAPWIARPSKTPSVRWFGAYHARENMAQLLAQSYAALGIPQDHLRIFDRDLPAGGLIKGDNPFHTQVLFNPAYANDWISFLTKPTAARR